MAQKKNYSRYFIILQQDEKGYALDRDKEVSGYAKLEMKNEKCKVTFYVQNLKKGVEPYSLMLVCCKNDLKKLVKLGKLNVDENGRAEVSFEYEGTNIGDTRVSFDKVAGAAIVKLQDKNINPILSGFATNNPPKGWLRFDVLEKVEKSEVEKVEVEKKVEAKAPEVEPRFDDYEKKIEEEKTKSKVEAEEKQPVLTVEANKQNQPEEEQPVLTTKLNEEDNNVREDAIRSSLGLERDYPKGVEGEFFMSLLQGYEDMKDICKEVKRCKWVKIPITKYVDVNDDQYFKKYSIIYYPMNAYMPYINKYGYYMIGLKCDKNKCMKYLVYGIPGKKNEQPYGGKTGFVTWVPMKDEDDEMGCWLMFYDYKTCNIVIPIKR